MKKFIVVACLSLSLIGCTVIQQLTNISSGFAITQSQVDEARASYDGLFLTPAAHYNQLPVCKTGQTFLLNKCKDKTKILALRAADKVVSDAFIKLQIQLDTKNTTGISGAYQALQTAVAAAQDLIKAYGIS